MTTPYDIACEPEGQCACPKCYAVSPKRAVFCMNCGCLLRKGLGGQAASDVAGSVPAASKGLDDREDHIKTVGVRQRGALLALATAFCLWMIVAMAMSLASSVPRGINPKILSLLLVAGCIGSTVSHIYFLLLSIELRKLWVWLVPTVFWMLLGIGAAVSHRPGEMMGVAVLLAFLELSGLIFVNSLATTLLREAGLQVTLLGVSADDLARPLPTVEAAVARRKTGMASGSLAFGILGILFFPFAFFAIALGIAALVKIRKRPEEFGGRKAAVVGTCLGGLVLLVALLVGIILIVMATP